MKKRNQAILILGIIVLAIALIIFLVTAAINGWDFLAWAKSSGGIWTFTLIGLYALGVVVYLVWDKWRRL